MTRSSLADRLATIVPSNISSLPVYQPGKPLSELERELGITGAIKLASNESVTGPSPLAVEAMLSMLANAAEYPDGGAFALRRALAADLGVDPTELIFGAGCNEIIHMAVRTLCHPGRDQILTHDYAFVSYKIAALGHGAPFVSTQTTDVLGCDVDALLGAIGDDTRVVFVANPNNPTGSHLTPEELDAIATGVPDNVLLVLDEAYFEYAIRTGVPYKSAFELRKKRPMLLILRTFSKIHGLAGLRVGYGIGRPELISIIDRGRRPFNVNAIAQAAATAAIGDKAHVERAASAAISGVAQLRAGAEALGVTCYPSLGNFVLVNLDRDADPVNSELLSRGVIVRPMRAWGLPTCLRISSGTSEQNKRALKTLGEVLGG